MTLAEPEPLGALIRRLRLSAGLSQEQLAERSGLSARAVSDLERGLRERTRPETLRMLADGLALGVDERGALFEASRPDLHRSPGPPPSGRTPKIELPEGSLPLIGREREVETILSLLEGDVRLITLTGPGGVGKTRLAIEGARHGAARFPDGVVFVDLSTITDFQRVPVTISRILQVRDSEETEIRETLMTALGERQMLLVLDNFEQVIDAAPVVGELVARAPHLFVLVTSREALRVRGEEEVVIEPLAVPADHEFTNFEAATRSSAVALFVRTAATAKPGFDLTPENAPTVAAICRKLDGLPLAIELAATRIRHFPPDVLLDHLANRLPLLTGGPRDLPARQQTLRATIAWSYDLLPPGEQALFRRIGVFAGGATIPAIEAVVPAGGELEIDVLSGLASLVEKSLLRENVVLVGPPRFSLLELIREFALDSLAQSGEEERLQRAHATWARDFVVSWVGDDLIPPMFRPADFSTIDGELENIRSAVDYFDARSDAESYATLFAGLFLYLYMRGRFGEAVSIGRRATQLAEERAVPDRLKGITYCSLAVIESMVGEAERGESLAREGLQILRHSSRDIRDLSSALISLVIAIRNQGKFAEAMEFAEEAFDIADTGGDRNWSSFARYHIGKLAFLQGDLDHAVDCLQRALDESRASGWNETSLYAANYLAALHAKRGELAEAIDVLQVMVAWWQEFEFGAAGTFIHIAAPLATMADQPVDAVRILGASSNYVSGIGVAVLEEPWIADLKEDLRVQLGDDSFDAAYREGERLSADETFAYLLELLNRIKDQEANRTGKPVCDDS